MWHLLMVVVAATVVVVGSVIETWQVKGALGAAVNSPRTPTNHVVDTLRMSPCP